MKIINKTKNTILAETTIVADTFFKRLRGLLGRKNINPGEGLIMKPCKWIQTFFMHFPVDVIFVNTENKVIAIKSYLKPWRIGSFCWQTKFVIELPGGTIRKTLTSLDDEIELI